MNLRNASIAGYFILVVSLVLLVAQSAIIASGIFPLAVQGLSVVLMVWARTTFGKRSFHAGADPTQGGLVTSGPYKYIRHPIYASVLYFMWAGVCSHPEYLNITLGIIGTLGISLRIYAEEQLVVVQYPQYTEYAARTKRIIPYLF
jgi:protein-S-isoprenylcysteine O-methyltransferase Ste14